MIIRELFLNLILRVGIFVFFIIFFKIYFWIFRGYNEFNKYGLSSFEYQFIIEGATSQEVYDKLVSWSERYECTTVDSKRPYYLKLTQDKYSIEEEKGIRWQYTLDTVQFRIVSEGERVSLRITLTPIIENLSHIRIGEIILYFGRFIEKIYLDFHNTLSEHEKTQFYQKDILKESLKDYKRAYQKSFFVLFITILMLLTPFIIGFGNISGNIFSIGIVGFMIFLAKATGEYGTYCDIERKINSVTI